jgi:hypothetical protein
LTDTGRGVNSTRPWLPEMNMEWWTKTVTPWWWLPSQWLETWLENVKQPKTVLPWKALGTTKKAKWK